MPLLRIALQQANSSGTRSTALTDLRYFAALALSAFLIAVKLQADQWIEIALGSLVAVIALAYLWAYIYFAFRSPDALRSEKFTLSKMAIEKSLTGDSLAGFVDADAGKPSLKSATPTLVDDANE